MTTTPTNPTLPIPNPDNKTQHLDRLSAEFDKAKENWRHDSDDVVELALQTIVHSVLADRPDAKVIAVETSDQGNFLSLGDVDGEEYGYGERADHFDDASDACGWISWSQASELGRSQRRGWVVLNERGGYYQIDVPAFLAPDRQEVGDRVRVTRWGGGSVDEAALVPLGTEGTVTWVSDSQVAVKWDNGSSLILVVGADQWEDVQ